MKTSAILCLAAIAAATTTNDYPLYKVPSFNINALNADAQQNLIQALEQDGIIAFQDIPNFPTLRRNYLQTAAECANKAKDLDLLMNKELVDGTQRKTFSINMNGLDKSIVDRCPEYAAAHDQYTKMVDGVTKTFAAVMDDINPDFSSQLLSPVVENGKHLDHFHAYSKPADVDPKKASAQLSLDIHADADHPAVDAIGRAFLHALHDLALVGQVLVVARLHTLVLGRSAALARDPEAQLAAVVAGGQDTTDGTAQRRHRVVHEAFDQETRGRGIEGKNISPIHARTTDAGAV
ncbi:Aste57867_16993 [Aphanomyces stellatus]|uniref:Aste57867_16993 protein n=1 Tax=Aphanomyces stellatus TaxID=120398 RepID=A0A485L9Y0_9STRA|nr:hypothetical protein As57867_016935 [Aphanomyces stellatus]VFT93754.1 Aste57867_16993 [Aphanomyces stellatus]